MKMCTRCKKEKPQSHFGKNKTSNDGLSLWCVDCMKFNHRRWRNNNREKLRENSAKERKRLGAEGKKYQADWMKKNRLKHKDRVYARNTVYTAVKAGTLIKTHCVYCGDTEVEAHHNDYSKRLDVMWLCRAHHSAWHRVFEVENGGS
jgi:hypothetical protein